jgi:adenylate kinase
MANRRFLAEELIPMAQVDPKVLDILDTDAYIIEAAEHGSVSRRIIRDIKDVQAKREADAQQQQMQQMAETAQPASEALKNVAQAKEMGIGI